MEPGASSATLERRSSSVYSAPSARGHSIVLLTSRASAAAHRGTDELDGGLHLQGSASALAQALSGCLPGFVRRVMTARVESSSTWCQVGCRLSAAGARTVPSSD